MKKYLALPLFAAFAVTPAFAQVDELPGRAMPGSGAEQRDDDVWRGADTSADAEIGAGIEADDDLVIGSEAELEGELYTGRSSTRGLPAGRALPGSGSEQRDENVWYGREDSF